MIPTKEDYDHACKRLEQIIDLVNNNTPVTDPNFQELDRVSKIIEAYEEEHYLIGEPILEYKGFSGPVVYDEKVKSYDGLVKGVDNAVIVYQGETLEELEASFRNGIDLYLEEKTTPDEA